MFVLYKLRRVVYPGKVRNMCYTFPLQARYMYRKQTQRRKKYLVRTVTVSSNAAHTYYTM
jgi:ribosomal protein S30